MRLRSGAAVTFALVAATGSLAAFSGAGVPVPVRATPNDEISPIADGAVLAWMERRSAEPYAIFVRRGGSAPRRVPLATAGAAKAILQLGSLTGNDLVFLETDTVGGEATQLLVRYDVASRRLRTIPTEPWTKSIVLRVRAWRNALLLSDFVPGRGGQRLVLGDLARRSVRVLDTAAPVEDDFFVPGQINGRYAVWTKCSPFPTQCAVVKLDLATKRRTVLPSPAGTVQYAASVTPGGTVYLARSGPSCGEAVSILRVPGSGSWRVLTTLPEGFDVQTTYANVRGTSSEVYYDLNRCPDPAATRPPPADIYRLNG